ncbi:MAG: hypothetical protein VR70_08075 [Rhodospirillaceae bacterium BRH_c57]|nr:MAG: hypothetical protein VR70_08075 [Rhodospirillaceae bacterium BRH_c57]
MKSNIKSPNSTCGIITREELAGALDISLRTLKRYEAARIGPPLIRIGRKVLYQETTVREWLAGLERPAVRRRR